MFLEGVILAQEAFAAKKKAQQTMLSHQPATLEGGTIGLNFTSTSRTGVVVLPLDIIE